VDRNWVFDEPFAQDYTKERQAVIGDFLTAVKEPMRLISALDVGCGVGYFSKFLSDLGFRVVAVDGRDENAAEGQRRYPEVKFLARNVEHPDLPDLGIFDLVLCVGLVYHLENPFRAIRSLYALTGKILIVEALCAHGTKPLLQLVDEVSGADQSLNNVAFYPTEACLAKMLYRAGFRFVYRFRRLPGHRLFLASLWPRKKRTILVASKDALTVTEVKLLPDIRGS
jgi:SAM-dependent methyltransferase